jgi:hypothetical protein
MALVSPPALLSATLPLAEANVTNLTTDLAERVILAPASSSRNVVAPPTDVVPLRVVSAPLGVANPLEVVQRDDAGWCMGLFNLQAPSPHAGPNARFWAASDGTTYFVAGDDAGPGFAPNLQIIFDGDVTISGLAGTTVRVSRPGHLVINAHTAPADSDLSAGDCAFWFDQTNGAAKLMIKAKTANGTVATGSVALA